MMQPQEFADYHRDALEAEEVRHNLLLAILGHMSAGAADDVRRWTLGRPGQCAVQTPGFPIVLGDIDRTQCRRLAQDTREIDYPGVVGPDLTARWFVERAEELGIAFDAPIPQQILQLATKPRYPGAPGHARTVEPDDADTFIDWIVAFTREAVPHDRPPDPDRLKKAIGDKRHMFWIVDGAPVSLAGIARRTRHAAAIAHVYTPPALRARGYAGSVVAAVVELAFAQGKNVACLYTDLRNPSSNRCYAKIGFAPVCASFHCPRAAALTPAPIA